MAFGLVMGTLSMLPWFLVESVHGDMPMRYATYQPEYEIWHRISSFLNYSLGASVLIVLLSCVLLLQSVFIKKSQD